MKAPLKWLRDYVDITLPAAEIARRLTMAGHEVKDMEVTGSDWEGVVVGQIMEIKPHPNADRLTLPTVDLGAGQETVVCGAPNLRVGDKIAFARVGAQILDPATGKLARLTPSKIRGVVSSGMVCSERELGISDNHQGIMVLPPDAPVGMPLAGYLGDTILDLDITPNRPDCLSITGLAREIAALTGQSFRSPDTGYEEAGPEIGRQVSVTIADPALCPRYCASLVNGVTVAPSPPWMQARLRACGMRPINNVVDITNYVMLEYGQPLHAFDYDKLGGKVIIRPAREGETLVTLDGEERTLSADMLVIADEGRAVALAGVMGGASTEVTGGTTSILLESASFYPASIHHTSQKLLLGSEASARFERGISAGVSGSALRRATRLLVELAGGKASQGIIDNYPGRAEIAPIPLSAGEIKRILGVELALEEIAGALSSLGFDCKADGTELKVAAPYWRSDIRLTVDLVEEVARVTGYDRIPMTMLSQPIPRHDPDPLIALRQQVRQGLACYGFQEVVTFSLVGRATLERLAAEPRPLEPEPLRVTNPMTADQEYLRPNLRGNLLLALSANRRHESGGMKLFELGKVYLPREKMLPAEPYALCGILSGARTERTWLTGDQPVDFFDAKGVVEGIFARLGIEAGFEPGEDEGLHPARQAGIVVAGERVGVLGEAHPKVLHAFEIGEPVYLFEVDISALLPHAAAIKTFQPLPRFPGTFRDVALLVDAGTSYRQLYDIIKGFPLVSQVALFDLFTGGPVPEGKKSMAYRIIFRAPDHTLTDAEVDEVQRQVLGRLEKELGAVQR